MTHLTLCLRYIIAMLFSFEQSERIEWRLSHSVGLPFAYPDTTEQILNIFDVFGYSINIR
jgi:hypothetical protein